MRAVINQDMQITGLYDYMPFGEQIPISLTGTKDRLSYIGKENDVESGLGDFGVRKYDGGRFLSIDRSHSRGWEKYLAWSQFNKIYLFLYRLLNKSIKRLR